MSDIDDILRDLLANPPRLPRSHQTGVFSSPESPPDDREVDDLIYRHVPAGQPLPVCVSCDTTLPPGTSHWHYGFQDKQYWWCSTCMSDRFHIHPDLEEPV